MTPPLDPNAATLPPKTLDFIPADPAATLPQQSAGEASVAAESVPGYELLGELGHRTSTLASRPRKNSQIS